MHRNRSIAPQTYRQRHLDCISERTSPRSEARRRQFISTATNVARWRPCWLHHDDRRLTVLIVNEVLVAHLVFSILRMQKAFELQSFENMLQSLQIFGWFFNPLHRFDDKKRTVCRLWNSAQKSTIDRAQDDGVDAVADVTLGFSFDRFRSWLLDFFFFFCW